MNAPLPTPLWVMSVPVISTAHLPAPNTLETWQGTPVVLTPDGGFLYIPNGDECGPVSGHVRGRRHPHPRQRQGQRRCAA